MTIVSARVITEPTVAERDWAEIAAAAPALAATAQRYLGPARAVVAPRHRHPHGRFAAALLPASSGVSPRARPVLGVGGRTSSPTSWPWLVT